MFSPLPRTCEEKSGEGSAPALFRKVSGPQPTTALSGEKASGSGSDRSGNLVESGIGNHVGMDAQRPFDHSCEHAGNLGKFVFVVIFSVDAVFPETVRIDFLTALRDQGHLVQESLLLAKKRNDLAFHLAGEFRGRLRLEPHGYFANKH